MKRSVFLSLVLAAMFAATALAQESETPAPAQLRPAPPAPPSYSQPLPPVAAATPDPAQTAVVFSTAIPQAQPYNMPMQLRPAPPTPPGYFSYWGGGCYGSLGYGYPYSPYCQPLWPEGAIKTSGDVRDTDLWLNGCYAGDAGSFDNRWNQKLAASAGGMIVVTVRRKSDNQSYQTPIRLTSEWLNRYVGGRHLPFRVNKLDLDSGVPFDREAAIAECAVWQIK